MSAVPANLYGSFRTTVGTLHFPTVSALLLSWLITLTTLNLIEPSPDRTGSSMSSINGAAASHNGTREENAASHLSQTGGNEHAAEDSATPIPLGIGTAGKFTGVLEGSWEEELGALIADLRRADQPGNSYSRIFHNEEGVSKADVREQASDQEREKAMVRSTECLKGMAPSGVQTGAAFQAAYDPPRRCSLPWSCMLNSSYTMPGTEAKVTPQGLGADTL
eukprot:2080428-Rhodomonas_salina.1